jgi:hypothetical protein
VLVLVCLPLRIKQRYRMSAPRERQVPRRHLMLLLLTQERRWWPPWLRPTHLPSRAQLLQLVLVRSVGGLGLRLLLLRLLS